jgi:pre-mRNA-splicing factor ISY1
VIEASIDKPAPKKGKGGKGKRKAAADEEVAETTEEAEAKKAKTAEEGEDGAANGAGDELAKQMAATTANYFGMFEPDSLTMPEVPSHEQMAEALLEVRKKALREEYGV